MISIDFNDLIKALEDYYIKEIFNIREDKETRDNIKINKLESIINSCNQYKLFLPMKLAENSIKRILTEE